jgi:hypothetical protein
MCTGLPVIVSSRRCRLIETAEVELGKAEATERKKKVREE